MSGRREAPAVVAYAGEDDLVDPDGRIRVERVDSAVVADYAPYADCVVLEEPGGGIRALRAMRGRAVPTVLYDRTADPAIAARATRLGVDEYVTESALGERALVEPIVSVLRESGRAAGQTTAVGELRSILSDRSLSSEERIGRLFDVGQRRLGLEMGALTEIEDGEYTIVGGTEAACRTDVPLSKSLCRLAVRTDGAVWLPDTAWGPPAGGLGDPFRRLGSYVGDDFEAAGRYGTVWFGSERSRRAFSTAERAFFGLLVEVLRIELADRWGTDAAASRSQRSKAESLASDGSGDAELDGLPAAVPSNSPNHKPSITGSDTQDGRPRPVLSDDVGSCGDGVDAEGSGYGRFRDLFEGFPDAVVDLEFRDGTPVVRDVNGAFEETFGYDGSVARDTPVGELIAPPGERAEAERLNENEIPRDGAAEVERMTAEGRESFLLRGVRYRYGGCDRGFVVYSDIADRLEQERQLRVLHRVLRHNLRNEMTAIMGYADMLAGEQQAAERREFAERIYDEAADVSELGEQVRRIEQALDVDRRQVSVDPEPIVRDLAERFRTQYPDATVRVSTTGDGAVVADELLETAVENLVENAVEHHPGEPTVEIEIAPVDAERIDLTVRDDGKGIPERERAIVSGDREITQLDHSRGLGLWVSRWIVSGVGGELLFGDCRSGSEVTLRLRRADGR